MRKTMTLLRRGRPLSKTFLRIIKFFTEPNCTSNPSATFMAKTFGQLDRIRLVIRIVQNGVAPFLCSTSFYPSQKIVSFTLLPFSSFLHEPSAPPPWHHPYPICWCLSRNSQTEESKKREHKNWESKTKTISDFLKHLLFEQQ